MRDLTVYPVTAQEAVSAIQLALESYTKNIEEIGVGNVDGVALLMAEQFIDANRERFDIFAKASLQVVLEGNE
jgi:hypothetical protein